MLTCSPGATSNSLLLASCLSGVSFPVVRAITVASLRVLRTVPENASRIRRTPVRPRRSAGEDSNAAFVGHDAKKKVAAERNPR